MFKKVILIGLIFLISSCTSESNYSFYGSNISKANLDSSFELISHNGDVKKIDDFQGSVVAIFFGFTHCPDICPTSLQELKIINKNLANLSNQFQVLFVSLDPSRDKPELLKKYVPSFDKSFIGLTGSQDQIDKIASQYKIFHKKVGDEKNYTIDHSSGIYLLDKNGNIRVRYPYGSKIDGMVDDIKYLISI